MKRKFKVDSDKQCSLNYDIHGEDDIEQELEEDNKKIFILLTLLYLKIKKKNIKIIICKYLIVSETLQKMLKDFIVILRT